MQIETSGEVAVLPMRAGKANAIGSAFLDRLSAQLDAVEASGASALVLTGEGRAFSAGLDLPEVSRLDRGALERFIRRFSEVMLRVFALPVPVVAAINGHAIAGGCVLAMQADVRLAAEGDYRIGLNEVAIGLGRDRGVRVQRRGRDGSNRLHQQASPDPQRASTEFQQRRHS